MSRSRDRLSMHDPSAHRALLPLDRRLTASELSCRLDLTHQQSRCHCSSLAINRQHSLCAICTASSTEDAGLGVLGHADVGEDGLHVQPDRLRQGGCHQDKACARPHCLLQGSGLQARPRSVTCKRSAGCPSACIASDRQARFSSTHYMNCWTRCLGMATQPVTPQACPWALQGCSLRLQSHGDLASTPSQRLLTRAMAKTTAIVSCTMERQTVQARPQHLQERMIKLLYDSACHRQLRART